jgi:hypothetical protein
MFFGSLTDQVAGEKYQNMDLKFQCQKKKKN